jgi:uncharacterized protein
LCKINEELYSLLNSNNQWDIEGDETLQILFKNKVLTKNEDEDILMYIASIESQRRISSLLNLTLAPTMDCNFSCPYCFETKEKGIMPDHTVKNVINFIANSLRIGIKHINLTWFGGEPLLAVPVIKEIYEKLKEVKNSVTIFQNIITNGYLLTDDNLKILEMCEINNIQLSMDGIFEHHNKKRFTKTDKDTFSTIIKNIENYIEKDYKMTLSIRVGIDGENVNQYEEIHRFYTDRYGKNDKIKIYPAFIVDTTKGENKNTIKNEMIKFEFKKLLVKEFSDTKFIYPTDTISECAIRNNNAWAIDSNANVYKCWEIMGNTDYKVGKLTEEGIEITNITMLNKYLFGADHLRDSKCLNCLNIVNCSGGCPHRRIENEYHNKDFNLCSGFDSEFDNYILERIKIYENEK